MWKIYDQINLHAQRAQKVIYDRNIRRGELNRQLILTHVMLVAGNIWRGTIYERLKNKTRLNFKKKSVNEKIV